MWRMKTMAISVVVLGALLFGAAVAYAGWSWNAKIDVEGTSISTSWSVAQGGKAQYQASIDVTVPKNADIGVVEVARSETVNVFHTNEDCSGGFINANVTYRISGNGHGEDVSVSVINVDTGQVYKSASGTLDNPISVDILIPGECGN